MKSGDYSALCSHTSRPLTETRHWIILPCKKFCFSKASPICRTQRHCRPIQIHASFAFPPLYTHISQLFILRLPSANVCTPSASLVRINKVTYGPFTLKVVQDHLFLLVFTNYVIFRFFFFFLNELAPLSK